MLVIKASNLSPMLKERLLDELFDQGIKRRVAELILDGKREFLMGSGVPDALRAEFPNNFYVARRSSFQALVNEVLTTLRSFLNDEDNLTGLAQEIGANPNDVRATCRMLLR